MNLGAMRRNRSHAYAILGAFTSKMPPVTKWWPLPGDDEMKVANQESVEVSKKEFMKAFGASFRPN